MSILKARNDYIYNPLKEVVEDESNEDPSHNQRVQSGFRRISIPWVASTIALALLSIVLAIQNQRIRYNGYKQLNEMDTYETGFETEIALSDCPKVKIKRHAFLGTPKFHENGSAYQDVDDAQIVYAGLPTPEIDRAWDDLIGHRYFYISEEEAQEVFENEYTEFELERGKYIVGIDVLHQLHCLNTLRKYLDYEYYAEDLKSTHAYGRLHIDHCVDQIRQSLQCAGDLTPIPTKYYPGAGGFVVTDRMHTCRDFEELQRWASKRFLHRPALPEDEGRPTSSRDVPSQFTL